ncbi:hypothetical protein BDC45DRAFT_536492 [Circinella umbellata]|nr:hypothetical protein BDC45DRAFT_536492 [Circinella umbellata]
MLVSKEQLTKILHVLRYEGGLTFFNIVALWGNFITHVKKFSPETEKNVLRIHSTKSYICFNLRNCRVKYYQRQYDYYVLLLITFAPSMFRKYLPMGLLDGRKFLWK